MREPSTSGGLLLRILERLRTAKLFAKVAGRSARSRKVRALIERSSLFDSDWYLQTYPDVSKSGLDPLQHYMDIGWREGRDPGPEFATSAYLQANADVARSGINPLLHYIEFGHSEGRGTADHLPALEEFDPSGFDLPPAAPCASFPIAAAEHPHWTRRAQGRDSVAPVDGAGEQAFAMLSFLSGYRNQVEREELPISTEQFADAWYVNPTLLRTRWTGGRFPFVVRAFQCDPLREGTISLVGEGATSGPLDVVDLQLANPFMPILLIFAELDGTPRGEKILALPSLCRGGVHHAEVLLEDATAFDPFGASDGIATRLLQLLRGGDSLSVKRMAVDLAGADGTGTLFQLDFQSWLRQVGRACLAPAPREYSKPGERYLAEMLAGNSKSEQEEPGEFLLIGHDMIPTIAALTELLGPRDQIAPVAFEGRSINEPIVLARIADDVGALIDRFRLPSGHNWPSGTLRPCSGAPAAIRVRPNQPLSDAELLTPWSAPLPKAVFDQRQGITWLVDGREGTTQRLVRSLQCLALQTGAADDSIAVLGSADRTAIAVANELFNGRVRSCENFRAGIDQAGSALVGVIGSRVLLHDHRTATLLSSLLGSEAVTTASCVMISSERRGKVSQTWIADGGTIEGPEGDALEPVQAARVTAELWRSVYPVALPPIDLWVARKADATRWIDGSEADAGGLLHLCTSILTASLVGRPRSATFMPPLSKRGLRAQLAYA